MPTYIHWHEYVKGSAKIYMGCTSLHMKVQNYTYVWRLWCQDYSVQGWVLPLRTSLSVFESSLAADCRNDAAREETYMRMCRNVCEDSCILYVSIWHLSTYVYYMCPSDTYACATICEPNLHQQFPFTRMWNTGAYVGSQSIWCLVSATHSEKVCSKASETTHFVWRN